MPAVQPVKTDGCLCAAYGQGSEWLLVRRNDWGGAVGNLEEQETRALLLTELNEVQNASSPSQIGLFSMIALEFRSLPNRRGLRLEEERLLDVRRRFWVILVFRLLVAAPPFRRQSVSDVITRAGPLCPANM